MTCEADTEGLDLTQRQWLIWAEHALSPDLPSNNMAMSATIDGSIDAQRFENAFRQVVEESEALRTVLVLRDDSPRRFLRPVSEPTCDHVDLSGAANPDLAYGRWRDERCTRPFDMERRLFDSVLVRLGPHRVVWYLCQHHIISDISSFGLILERTARLYEDPESAVAERAAGETLKQLESEQSYLDSDRHTADEIFWKEHFAQPVEPLHPYGIDPARRGAARRYVSAALGLDRSTRLKSLAEDEGMRAATPALGVSALFTTALFAFLHRITGNASIGVGIPVQNRPSRWSRNAVGRFAETCPMRVRIEPGETFRTLHAKVAQESFSVLAHARCTLANPVRSRRFDAMLNFHNLTVRSFAGFTINLDFRTGLGAPPDRVLQTSPQWPDETLSQSWQTLDVLTLNVHDYAATGNFRLGFEFNSDVFDEALRARAIEHFSGMIDALLEDPGQRIDTASIVTSTEEGEAVDWAAIANEHAQLASNREPQQSLLGLFRKQVEANPDRIAILCGELTLSYGQVNDAARTLSTRLLQAGIGPMEIVGVCAEPSYWQVVSLLAIHEVGAVFLPLDDRDPPARLQAVLAEAVPSLILTDAALHANLSELGTACLRLDIDGVDAFDSRQPVETLLDGRFEQASDEVACIVYVSDPSGRPTGIEINHRALGNFLESMSRAPGLKASDRVLAMNPASFEAAAFDVLAPLSVGGGVEFVLGNSIYRDAEALANRLADPALSVVRADCETWSLLVESGWSGRSDLRLVISGSVPDRPLADALIARAGEVWSVRGEVESTFVSSVERVEADAGAVTIGMPIDGTTHYVLTPDLEAVPLGTVGELYLAGASLTCTNRSRTAESFDRFVWPNEESEMCLFKTGESVRRRLDGQIESLRRLDHQVRLNGDRFALEEIEAAILGFKPVANVIVTLSEHSTSHQELVGYVELEKEEDFEVHALEAHLRTLLPLAAVPTDWRIIEALPRTQDGRLDRDTMVDTLRRPESARHQEPPRHDIEIQIANLFQELLGVSHVSRDDDFFDLGGVSLLAVEATRRLGSILGRKVDLPILFEHSTVAGLATALKKTSGGSSQTMAVELRAGPQEATLFCIAGVSVYQELAKAFVAPLRVYGLSVDQEMEWIEAVERGETPRVSPTRQTAKEYIATLRKLQPNGPYRLAGISYGGVLAFEIAQQLLREGEEIAGLVLLDARLPRSLTNAFGPFGALRLRFRHVRRDARWAFWRDPVELDRGEIRYRLFVAESRRYEAKISAYPGSALLCRALGHRPEEIDFDATLGWSKWIRGGLTLASRPGGHLELVSSENAPGTAKEIERYLGLHEARTRKS